LFGNEGNDRLQGGTGNDLLNGGLGSDTADYSNIVISGTTYIGATAGVIVNLNLAGAQNTRGAGLDTLVSIENLTGTNFNDALAGNSGTNVLAGLAGNDILAGAGGTDQLLGGDGNDLLNGGVGNDILNGGAGSDTADYGTFLIGGQFVTGATAGVRVNLNLAGAQNTGGAGIDTLVSIENLTGSIFNDVLTGNSANNILTGREGNDRLIGGGGNDTLNGGLGNDILNGGASMDTASYSTATAGVTVNLDLPDAQNTGGAGIDTLVSIESLVGSKLNDILNGTFADNIMIKGGAGNDVLSLSSFFLSDSTLSGGTGADRLIKGDGPTDSGVTVTFDYNMVSDSLAGAGKDTIIGFTGVSGFEEENEDGDQIDLRDIDARPSVCGNQAFIWGGPFTEGHLRYVGGVLQGNLDADAAPEFEIQLIGAPALFVQAGHPGSDILL
jgi:Ca2+-binding RTX toxin-like protein